MYSKILTQTAFDIVTLEEAKMQCRLTSSQDHEDTYLSSLIDTCCELAQNYTSRMLSTGTVKAFSEVYSLYLRLPYGDVSEVTEVTAENESGKTVTLSDFSFNDVTQRLTIPSDYAFYTNFYVTYACGYSVVPTKVKQGILLMIASMFSNREDGLIGQSYQKLPMSSLTLLDSVRIFEV